MNIKTTNSASRVERKKEETKQKIIAVAMRLFHDQGIEETTMELIAAEVDIAKGTLYNYFPEKEAIIGEYIKRSSVEKNSERALRLAKLPDTRSRMIWSFNELIQAVRAQKKFFEKYFVYQMKNTLSLQKGESEKSGMELLAAEIIRLGRQETEIREDLPQDVMEDLFVFAFIKVVKRFYTDPEQFNAQVIIEQCVDLFINGVKTKPN